MRVILLLAALLGCVLAASVDHPNPREKGNRPLVPPKADLSQLEKGEAADKDGQRLYRRAACPVPKLWPDGQVCNFYSASFSDDNMKTSIQNAIHDIESVSCVSFSLEMSHDSCAIVDAEPDKVEEKDTGCWANIGCSDSVSLTLNLPTQCDMYGHGVVIHELMHVLGRYHEHTRQDRDDYVTYIEENVKNEDLKHNFEKCDREVYGIPYDYLSIMHYATNFFSKDPATKPTLTVKDDNYAGKIGRQEKMSTLDVLTINKMYGCYDKAGITDPTNCKRKGVKKYDGTCYCAPPFTGNDCGSIDSDEGEHYQNDGSKEMTVKSKHFPAVYPLNFREVFILECTNTNQLAQFKFDVFEVEAYKCGYDKFKFTISGADINPAVKCDNQMKGKTVHSEDNVIVMELISDDMYNYKGFNGTFSCH